MELWQWVDQNYNAIIDCFIFASFWAALYIMACRKDIKDLKKQLDEKEKMIAEMDEFIENNSRVWQ